MYADDTNITLVATELNVLEREMHAACPLKRSS